MTRQEFHNAVVTIAKAAVRAEKQQYDGMGWHRRDNNTPTQKVRWFRAYRDARSLLDSNTTKDWAEMLLDGLKPYPKSMAKNVDEMWEETNVEEEAEGLVAEMGDFYAN